MGLGVLTHLSEVFSRNQMRNMHTVLRAGPGTLREGLSPTPTPSTTPDHQHLHLCQRLSVAPELPWPLSGQVTHSQQPSPATLALSRDHSEVQNFLCCQTGFPRDGARVAHDGNRLHPAPFVDLLFHSHFPPPPGAPGVTSQIHVLGEPRSIEAPPAGPAHTPACR